MLPVLLFALSGCGLVNAMNDLKLKFLDVTSPVVVHGIVVDLQPPDDDLLNEALESIGFELGTTATVFVADALTDEDMDQDVDGAQVWVEGIPATLDELGAFVVMPADGLSYRVGETWTFEVERAGEAGLGVLDVVLPQSASMTVPEEHTTGQPLVLDLTGQGFDSALAYVFDIEGVMTWSNQPADANDALDILTNDEPLQKLQIPGSAFPDPTAYVVSVAAMKHGDIDTSDGVNTLLSGTMAGQMQLFPVFTAPPVVAQGQIIGVMEADDPRLVKALADTDLAPGVTATVFLADAREQEDIDAAAVTGGIVTLTGGATVQAEDQGDGTYFVPTTDALVWEQGADWVVDIEVDEVVGFMEITLPGFALIDVPDEHKRNEDLVVDFTDQNFDSSLVVVVDGAGEVLFSNEITDAEAFLEMMDAPPPLGEVVVPGDVFGDVGLYGVATVAFRHGQEHRRDGVVVEVSGLMAGRMVLHPVLVRP